METPGHVDSLFVFESGSINTIIKDNHGTIYTGGKEAEATATEDGGEEDIEMLIDDLLAMKELFTDQVQWYAVYRVLNEKKNFPNKMTDFSRKMQAMGYAEASVPCAYNSLKQGSRECPELMAPVERWGKFRNLSDKYKRQCEVACFLLEKLAS